MQENALQDILSGTTLKIDKGVDFEAVTNLETLASLIKDGDDINIEIGENKKNFNTIKEQFSSKEKEFMEYIENNKICPLTQMAFSETCLQRLKEGYLQ